jgi:hypothetical protein
MKIAFYLIPWCIYFSCTVSKLHNTDTIDRNYIFEGIKMYRNEEDSMFEDYPYDDTGGSIFNRKIVYRDLSATKAKFCANGKIAFKICINPEGKVTYSDLIENETTLNGEDQRIVYQKASLGYCFAVNKSAPALECGKL